MIKAVDNILNNITMYKLVLYVLIFILIVALFLSLFGLLSFPAFSLLITSVFIIFICWISNTALASVFKIPTNAESVYITGFILSLIISPVQNLEDLLTVAFIAVVASASKYILAVNKKHIFNPAAFAVVVSSLVFGYFASWWIGNLLMVPIILLGGLLVIKKVQRFALALSFLTVSLTTIFVTNFLDSSSLGIVLKTLLSSQILFYSCIMLTEPQTSPPTKKLQVMYGGLVGLLYSLPLHFGQFYMTPEMSLLIGNIFSYLVGPKDRLILSLQEKVKIGADLYKFVFGLEKKLVFMPGQYMEWTLGHDKVDSRGVRRYFTIASSPTENNLQIGVKFYPKGSSFKRKLMSLNKGDKILAGQLAGEFNLPKDQDKKLVFLAGGIGITPFRSMVKYLLDQNEKRNIVLFYSVKSEGELAYRDIFDMAQQKLGIKVLYVLTEKQGYINEGMIKKEVPDYKDRIFYISGPHSMVDAFGETLKEMGISSSQIKTDFFPGYT